MARKCEKRIDFNFKRVADPVHGSIGLSELEARLIGTKAFLRLQNIKHLGLAHLVFPGADFSRFTHALGVCHVTGRIIEALRHNSSVDINEKEFQLYRLAALLHDIGHYPFSHPMERAVKDYYTRSVYVQQPTGTSPKSVQAEAELYEHEHLGRKVLSGDLQLSSYLREAGYSPEEVSSVFTREKPPRFTNLVNSDLDADRIDYLLRMGHHTGLPYGSIDLEYLLSQMTLDGKNQICVTRKAMRTAEHLLLSRYFAYQQIVYHHTVVAFERVLEDLLRELLSRQYVECSLAWVVKAVRDGTWYTFDDAYILGRIRKLLDDLPTGKDNDVLKAKAESVLYRNPPKLVGSYERLDARHSDAYNKSFRARKKRLQRERKATWARDFELDETLWYIWDIPGWTLTTIASHVPTSAAMVATASDKDKYEQSIRVLDISGKTSYAISDVEGALMSMLADQALYVQRIYVLLPNDANAKQLRKKIEERVREDESTME